MVHLYAWRSPLLELGAATPTLASWLLAARLLPVLALLHHRRVPLPFESTLLAFRFRF